MSEPPTPSAARHLGPLESVVTKWFTREAHVREVRTVADGFRLVTLGGQALEGVAWVPGQKVQLMLGGWVQRTYTPLSWDAARGTMQLLAYVHGEFPGSDWARALAVGQRCAVFGPRGSIDLTALARPGLVFGDETSIGLAHALRATATGAAGVEVVLEVTSLDAARAALQAVDVQGAHCIERRADDAHLTDVEAVVRRLREGHAVEGWVLTGKATSIQAMTKLLRQLGAPRARIQSKAYWAPGKTGLD
ncbi:MAG TPA: siderophore-interacting protein [Polyangiaceae bacterium]|nr:siderophore-interacting protein [Polyangiaceae bacterium]